MDNVTHSLFGWTLARTGAGRGLPYATATLILASNAPDADIVVAAFGGVEYLAAHRGPTHGPLGVIGLGLVVAGIVSAWARWRGRAAITGASPGTFARWWLLAMAGIVGHVLMDVPTVYGTRVLSPFAGTWFAVDWMPIVDVYLWIVLIGALAAGRVTGQRRRAAIAGLALMVANYAARAVLHERALADGAAFDAAGAPAACDRAPTLVAHRGGLHTTASAGAACLEAAALPTFVSPFTWRIVRRTPGGYEVSDRSVFAAPARQAVVTTLTSDAGPEVERARRTRAGEVYFDFARFPIVRIAGDRSGAAVRVFDARFVGLPSNSSLAHARTPLSLRIDLPCAGRAEEQPPTR